MIWQLQQPCSWCGARSGEPCTDVQLGRWVHLDRTCVNSDLISRALSEATTEQIKSEWAKRTQAMRKTKTGGRNGGTPKKAQSSAPACESPSLHPLPHRISP